MFENFSDRGRQVIVLGQGEARGLQHNYIGTEHLLLGVVLEGQGVAAQVLNSLGVTAERVRRQVVRIVGTGTDPVAGQVPFTQRARNAFQRANRARLSLGSAAVDPEHLLLALVRDDDGVAVRVLTYFQVDPETVRVAHPKRLRPVRGHLTKRGITGPTRACSAPERLVDSSQSAFDD